MPLTPITQPITREQFRETARAALDTYWPDARFEGDSTYEARATVEDFIDHALRNWPVIMNAAVVKWPIAKPPRLYNRHSRKRLLQANGGR